MWIKVNQNKVTTIPKYDFLYIEEISSFHKYLTADYYNWIKKSDDIFIYFNKYSFYWAFKIEELHYKQIYYICG